MTCRFRAFAIIAVFVVPCCSLVLQPASAIDLLVYNNNDSGAGSLQQAIEDNRILGGGNTIIFSNIVSGTITLTTGALSVTNNLTILGPGANVLAINGNYPTTTNRVFQFSNSTITLSGLTITNGHTAGNNYPTNSGGGIYNYHSTLTVSNCTFSGNYASYGGGIYNDAEFGSSTLTVTNCTFRGNSALNRGGGIYNDSYAGSALLTVSASTFSGNLAKTAGGGIYNFGYGSNVTSMVIASTVSSNSTASFGAGGGIYNEYATLTLIASTVSSNSTGSSGEGGGIYNDHGPLTLIASTLSSNSARYGGCVFNDGETLGSAPLTVSNCTLNGNSASSDGGGIYNAGYAGNAPLKVIASTFSGNSAYFGGGIYNGGFGTNATLTVSGSTLSGNSASFLGGGIYNDGIVLIGNTIFKAGVSGANFTNDVIGTITSQGYNLSSDSGSGYLTATGDQINTDALLGPLADNGGLTRTHLPLVGSPAIDQGKSLGLARDQHGRCRTFDNASIANATGGDGTDIGAVEVGTVATTVVATNADHGVSLRYCICEAQPGDTVTFASSVIGTVALTSGELLINKDLTIQGPGAKLLAISGNASNRVFHTSNSVVTISGLTITNGFTSGSGGGVYNDHSTLTVSNCIVSGNSAYYGGGIYNDGNNSGSATLKVIASTVSSNLAVYGGAIYNDGFGGSSTSTVSISTLSGNTADAGLGGAVYNTGNAMLTMIASTLNSNSAGQGGGIYNFKVNAANVAQTVIRNTILKAGAFGANLFNNGGTFTSDGYNLSSDNGGGLLTATGDQINTDPMLGPLADYGGPTPTMALRVGSPAIDKGKSFSLLADQRGFPRALDDLSINNAIGGDGADIGAFEVDPNFRIVEIRRTGTDVAMSLMTVLGKNYRAEYTNDLASGSWTAFTNNVPGNGWLLWVTNFGGANQPRRFYRGTILQ